MDGANTIGPRPATFFGLERRAPSYDVMLSPQFHLHFTYSLYFISTVGRNGKLSYMNKTFAEPGNTIDSYELDPSLVNNPDWADAWRRGGLLSQLVLDRCALSAAPPAWRFLTRPDES